MLTSPDYQLLNLNYVLQGDTLTVNLSFPQKLKILEKRQGFFIHQGYAAEGKSSPAAFCVPRLSAFGLLIMAYYGASLFYFESSYRDCFSLVF